jgi:hypothetical protein
VATQLLAIPRVEMTVEVFTNEDWLDALAYYDLANNPISLAGIHFALEMRHAVEDATALISITNNPDDDPTGGVIIITDNKFAISVPLSKMMRVPRGDYVFDAVGSADGLQRVIMTGTIAVIEGVTR